MNVLDTRGRMKSPRSMEQRPYGKRNFSRCKFTNTREKETVSLDESYEFQNRVINFGNSIY